MDFELTEEQQLLKNSAERFVLDHYAFEKRQALAETEPGYSVEHWHTFAELGWLGIPFAESLGGFGGKALDTMVIMEQFGKGLVLEPYLATVILGGNALRLGGSGQQQAAIIPGLIEGKTKLALAYAEPQSRYQLNDVATIARPDGNGFVIQGQKCVVLHGQCADHLIVSARTSGNQLDPDGLTLLLVDKAAKGLGMRGYRTVDGLRAADFTFDQVRVPADAVLGAQGKALPLLEQVLDYGIAAICAEAVGCLEAALNSTVEYLKTRKQFGQPIGNFQALQHRATDMYGAMEQSRSMASVACVKVELDPRERRRALSAAKAFIGRAGQLVGEEAVQMHGGIGVTHEAAIAHYFKRLTTINTWFGDAAHHLAIISSQV